MTIIDETWGRATPWARTRSRTTAAYGSDARCPRVSSSTTGASTSGK
jgi:hypothetical protein